jgi:hypothetical protein
MVDAQIVAHIPLLLLSSCIRYNSLCSATMHPIVQTKGRVPACTHTFGRWESVCSGVSAVFKLPYTVHNRTPKL